MIHPSPQLWIVLIVVQPSTLVDDKRSSSNNEEHSSSIERAASASVIEVGEVMSDIYWDVNVFRKGQI